MGKKEELSLIEAHAEIMNILSGIMQMGASDNSEKEKIENILERLRNNELTPAEAVKEARRFLNSKQDYH